MMMPEMECQKKIDYAKKLFLDKKYEDLVEAYKNIIEMKNNCAHVNDADIHIYYSNLSFAYFINKKYTEAIEAANKGLAVKKWYKLYFRSAKGYEGLLERENAANQYQLMESAAADDNETNTEDYKRCYNDAKNIDINILKQWLLLNNAKIDGIKIEYYDVDYRGMCVENSIKKDQPLMQIPASCVVSLEECKTRSYNKILTENKFGFNSPHTYLALELLDIKYTPNHHMQYYCRCLPKFFDNVPINFPANELEELKGSYSLIKIQQKKYYLLEEYNCMVKTLQSVGAKFPYSYDDFVWARTAVITRVYAVERYINGILTKDTVMVPFADMANHTIPANTHWSFDNNSNCFTVKATNYMNHGNVLYESYGAKCTYRYFVNYGFAVEDNPYEEVCIICNPALFPIIENRLYETNVDILQYLNGTSEIFQVGYDANISPFKAFTEFCTNKAESMYKTTPGEPAPDKDKLLVTTFIIIIGFAQKTLDLFDTSYEDDLKLYKMYNHTFNQRNCLIQKMGEKKLLLFYINYYTYLSKIVRSPKRADKNKLLKELKKKYIPTYASSFLTMAKQYIS